ncbi:MAG: alpha-E domain-containing protein [Methyloceanibacter sp.]
MLSRSAENLLWMARSMERAENSARMLDVSFRMSLLPSTLDKQALHFEPILAIAPGSGGFHERYGELNHETIIRYVALEPDNAGSIWSLVRQARENARAQRASISSEAWESLNSTWLEVQNLDFDGLKNWGYRDFFDWVKERSHLFRGVVFGTMLHDDAFRFIRLGTFIERADNTARILDVKYHVLLPDNEQVGGFVDYYQWGALLRSVGAFRAYRKAYHDTIFPWRIAELLILREDMPRSLHHCYENLIGTLEELAGKKQLECLRLAGQAYAGLKYGRIDRIMRSGLHEFLSTFIESNGALGVQIQEDFLMTPAVVAMAGAA